MTRIKGGVVTRRRRKAILKKTQGYYGARSRIFTVAKQAWIKACQYAYRDRRNKKRTFRALWCVKINALCRQHGMNYSTMMHLLKLRHCGLNRRVLSQIAEHDDQGFAMIIDKISAES